MSRWVSLATIVLSSCESSPVGPAEIQTIDRTALFNDIQVRLTGLNTSWMPRQGPVPSLGVRLVTIEIEVRSYDLEPRSIHPEEFHYRTWNGLLPYEPANTSLWRPSAGERQPVLEEIELENGQLTREWLTFRVPPGVAHRPDAFLWRPDPRVSFFFHLPTTSGSLVCGWTRIFGFVTGPQGSAVPSAPVELSFFDLDREENSFADGSCQGEVTFSAAVTADDRGSYEHSSGSRFCTERCVRLTASAPQNSDLKTVSISGGTIFPSAQNEIAEAPELRIDASLGSNE